MKVVPESEHFQEAIEYRSVAAHIKQKKMVFELRHVSIVQAGGRCWHICPPLQSL